MGLHSQLSLFITIKTYNNHSVWYLELGFVNKLKTGGPHAVPATTFLGSGWLANHASTEMEAGALIEMTRPSKRTPSLTLIWAKLREQPRNWCDSFLKWGYPLNHPFKWDFPLETIHFWGNPIYGNLHVTVAGSLGSTTAESTGFCWLIKGGKGQETLVKTCGRHSHTEAVKEGYTIP